MNTVHRNLDELQRRRVLEHVSVEVAGHRV
jgi:hypothetical protein